MSLRCAFALCVVFAVAPLHAAAPIPAIDAARVRLLLQQLDDEDFQVRQQADEALRNLGKAVQSLLAAENKRTPSLEVRWRLGRILTDLRIDEQVESLVRQLADGDAATRERAAWTLRKAGTVVVPFLRQELKPGLGAEQRKRVETIIAELSSVPR